MSKARTNYRSQADKAFSQYIRNRDQTCQAKDYGPGCKGHLQCAHIIGRGEQSIRVDPDNAITLCQSHHKYFTHRPAEWMDFIDTQYPGRFEMLRGRVRNHLAMRRKIDWREAAQTWKART